MSLKQEIETWVEALAKYDNNEFEEALKVFDNISDTSKILFNCGVIHATLGEHDKAVECYQRAVRLDQYLAVAYFQQGVSNFLVGDFEEALANFNDTLLYLRGNTYIDYEQLGLKFKLYSCEVLFNRGLCYIYLQQKQAGLGDLSYAAKEKVTTDHDVIDEAIREEADGYTVFSIPVGVVYRPNSSKVKNLKSKDYLGKARLIASTDRGNMFTGFAGAERRAIINADTSKDDRPPEGISYAASNLVRSDLTSRSQRQQSAPPINRNAFPPTPPPENDVRGGMTKPGVPEKPPMTARANSVRDGTGAGARMNSRRAPRPQPPLEEDPSPNMRQDGFQNMNPPEAYGERPRMGTMRTASEPRGPVSKYSTARPGRGHRGDRDDGPTSGRGRLFNEMTPRRQNSGEEADDEFPGELYDLYQTTAYSNPYSSGSRRGAPGGGSMRRMRSDYDDVDMERDSGGSSLDDFEMLNDAGGSLSATTRGMSTSRNASRTRRPIDIRTVRVKMHHGEDTRYLMVSTGMMWEEFLERAREKLALRQRFKVRMRDEGDMITVGDGDDWDMALQTAKREARRDGGDMARLEVWIADANGPGAM